MARVTTASLKSWAAYYGVAAQCAVQMGATTQAYDYAVRAARFADEVLARRRAWRVDAARWMGAAALVLLVVGRAEAQETHRIDWASSIALAAGQISDGVTTTAFVTGHGQAADHSGPCVEANPRFQPSAHQIARMWTAKAEVVSFSFAMNYFAERYARTHRGSHAAAVKWTSRGLNYFGAAIGAGAGIYNIAHCGLF